MNARFHAPAAETIGAVIALPDDEAQHLTRVLRLKAGAAIRVFDGRGHEFDALVESDGRNARKSVGTSAVQVRVVAAREPSAREPRVAVTLAQAVLKTENMDEAVRNAVMMGVAAIQPVVATRSEVTLASLQRGSRVERWTRIAVSSAKQCGRATVPVILEPWPFDALPAALSRLRLSDRLNAGPQMLPGPGLMFVEPSASMETIGLGDLDPAPPRDATIVTGPEGGWTLEEVEQASAACRLVTLGTLTVRADVMPVVALAALFTLWRDL